MAFIIGIVVVVAIDNARAVGQHNALLEGQAGADENRKVFTLCHIGLQACRYNRDSMGRQDDVPGRCQVVACTAGSFAYRQLYILVSIG